MMDCWLSCTGLREGSRKVILLDMDVRLVAMIRGLLLRTVEKCFMRDNVNAQLSNSYYLPARNTIVHINIFFMPFSASSFCPLPQHRQHPHPSPRKKNPGQHPELPHLRLAD